MKDVTRELSGWVWLEHLGQDLRFAMRQVYRTPGFSLAVILTLALGIGVNSAVFSMVNGFMLRPLPYPDADRVASLTSTPHGCLPATSRCSASGCCLAAALLPKKTVLADRKQSSSATPSGNLLFREIPTSWGTLRIARIQPAETLRME